jgi:hypothetical protein
VAPALLLVSAGTAHAIPDLPNEPVCPDCGGFNPQPDPPGFPERAIIDGPIIDACVGDPDQINIDGCRNGLGGPDTAPN